MNGRRAKAIRKEAVVYHRQHNLNIPFKSFYRHAKRAYNAR